MNQFNQNILFAFWQSTPIVNKLFIIIASIFWIVDLLIGDQLKFQPISLQYVWIWQLITSVFVQGSFCSFIFNLCCLPVFNNVERRLGSILYLLEFLIKNSIGMAFIFLVVKLYCLLINYDMEMMYSNHFGFWNIAVYFITTQALKQPNEETKVLFLPFVMKVRYYLICLLLFLQLFNQTRFTVLFFAQIALLEFIIYKGPLFRLPKQFIEQLEKKAFLQKCISRQDFIPIDQASDLVFSGTQKIEFQIENFHKEMELSPAGQMSSSQEKVPTEEESMHIK
ncbi:unnamed protein product (macronuclear) [Paramecium tetraurelia]|uniref:Transmembrane protein n=1 Tax=Paramecium tetraurelia TaxID=5888 RepID=A0CEZ5_PARTE|nr:uncharacterized protein GSPATT00037801001 [Paramecium tetraurelia]CAK69362.1 unnamed protein product [Paramecium tetraurelia]|eukprot:XP_001436759.1 hypothetical protein (macronuclear) [Paramecium tetraurelia strain d4-2]